MAASWQLSGRTVLITGAARGIGAEVARRLHDRGAKLALVGLEPEELERRTAELGGETAWFEADVTDQEALDAAVEGAVERFGGLDVAVANAGIATWGPLGSMDPDAFLRVIDVNLLGVWRTLRATQPHVVQRRGYLLPIASMAAAVHLPLMGAYNASKAGVEALADTLRVELEHTGTAVGCAYFSFIDTDMVRRGSERPSAQLAEERMGIGGRAPLPVAGRAVVQGIERRARRVVAPRYNTPALHLRTLVQAVAERRGRAKNVGEIVQLAAGEASELTTPQP